MRVDDFWYVVARSEDLRGDTVLARQVLDEWLVVFRGVDGAPAILQDRCSHRNSRLSLGKVCAGHLQCPYHGWTYNAEGQVTAVPAEGDGFQRLAERRARRYACREQDGYVYVRIAETPTEAVEPFPMPHWGVAPWRHIRLVNRIANNVTNCVENFIDVPHTVFVHPGIFRKSRGQLIEATLTRENGSVIVDYKNETDNLGWFSWFLNPKGTTISHQDRYFMPNVTNVEYSFGPRRVFIITSQSVPCSESETLVYTDLTYDYGIWNLFAGPIVRYQSQAVIDQDIVALGQQMEVIQKYGAAFSNTPADVIHVLVESIRDELARGGDPRGLPPKRLDVRFRV